ncbi:hypothetical protein [Thioalkalivibrio halophilus]|nr:hypothetical protein [Thioalkalivibrio halophilus]
MHSPMHPPGHPDPLRADLPGPAPGAPPGTPSQVTASGDLLRIEQDAPPDLRLTLRRRRWWQRLLRPLLGPLERPLPDSRLTRRVRISAASAADHEALRTSPSAQTALVDLFRAERHWPVDIVTVGFDNGRARIDGRILEPLDEERSRRLHAELHAHLDAASHALAMTFKGRAGRPAQHAAGASPVVMLGLLALGLVAILVVALL